MRSDRGRGRGQSYRGPMRGNRGPMRGNRGPMRGNCSQMRGGLSGVKDRVLAHPARPQRAGALGGRKYRD